MVLEVAVLGSYSIQILTYFINQITLYLGHEILSLTFFELLGPLLSPCLPFGCVSKQRLGQLINMFYGVRIIQDLDDLFGTAAEFAQ